MGVNTTVKIMTVPMSAVAKQDFDLEMMCILVTVGCARILLRLSWIVHFKWTVDLLAQIFGEDMINVLIMKIT